MKKSVWFVSHNFSLSLMAALMLRDSLGSRADQVLRFNRTQLFEEAAGGEEKPILIISTDTCKERGGPDGESIVVTYNKPAEFAAQNNIPFMRVPTFFGHSVLWILRLKIWWWKQGLPKQPTAN